MDNATLRSLAEVINRQELNHTFRIVGGKVVDADGMYAPEIYNSDTEDVEIHGAGWETLSGYTLQDSYSGAVMHSSEGVGTRIAERMAEIAADHPEAVFALTSVEVLPDDEDDEPEPAGWAVAYNTRAE